MPEDAPRVTLILAVRNEERYIEQCLASVSEQDYPHDRLDILVVDGQSSDATPSLVQRAAQMDPRIRLLTNREREMPYGLNIGISEASGEYIGSVIGHSVLPNDYVRRCVEALRRTGAWAVGGRYVRTADSRMQLAIALVTSSPVGVGDSRHNYGLTPGWAETAFPGFWRRDVFDRVGAFDPEMLVNEDNELAYRIRQAGGRIWYEPSIGVTYFPRSTLRGMFRQYRRYAMGKVRVARKHRGGGVSWRSAIPAAWLGWLVGGGIVAAYSRPVAAAWASLQAVYLGLIGIAALRLASPSVEWWRIAAAFVTLHVSYGIGVWEGVVTWATSHVAPPPNMEQ